MGGAVGVCDEEEGRKRARQPPGVDAAPGRGWLCTGGHLLLVLLAE